MKDKSTAAQGQQSVARRVCKICGEFEDEHHEPDWLEIPAGCVCDWREWNYETMTKIPPACEEYQGDGTHDCNRCEHDKECHQAPNVPS